MRTLMHHHHLWWGARQTHAWQDKITTKWTITSLNHLKILLCLRSVCQAWEPVGSESKQTFNCKMQIVSAALSRVVCLHGCRLRVAEVNLIRRSAAGPLNAAGWTLPVHNCLSITFAPLTVWLSSALPLLRVQPFPFSTCCVLPLLGFPSIFVTPSPCKPWENKPLLSAHICHFYSQSVMLLALKP